MPEQGITNDELARMIKDQFDLVGKRFGGIELTLEKMGLRLERQVKELMAVR